jgi:hypothetical protein
MASHFNPACAHELPGCALREARLDRGAHRYYGLRGPSALLAQDDAPRREAVLKDYLPVAREVGQKGTDNPRALWLMGL